MKLRICTLLLVVAGVSALSSCTPFAYGTAGRFAVYEDDDTVTAPHENSGGY